MAEPLRAPTHAHTHPHNLPVELTSFVGRARELAEVGRLLGATRLLTLTGAGGAGKTRLALRAAAAALPAYPDGAWLVELAALADPALVPQAAAAALGVAEEPGRSPLATLAAALAPKRVLLLLDNCEHLLDACARLADALLRACPSLTVLATSREPLGIAGEVTWRVPSLDLPDAADAARDAPPEALARGEAVRLFIERAQAARPGFALTDANAAAVAEVCRRLDGIPLALELAAARVRVLSVAQLAARLDDRFRLLTGGSRTALERHQTLRAAVDWSYGLLSADEQRLFDRLSVFAGGWTLEAAEAVCSGDGLEAGAILELLAHLVDKSLVLADDLADEPSDGPGLVGRADGPPESAPFPPPGERAVRYRLLETLRQYARQTLAARGGADVAHGPQGRHAAHYLALAEAAAAALHGPAQARWLARLAADHDNLRAAQRRLLDHQDLEGAVRLAWALQWFWDIRGHVAEGHAWLREVLALELMQAHPALRARALAAAGKLARVQWRPGEARRLLGESVALFRALGDGPGEAVALRELGVAAHRDGDGAAGRAALEASLALCRARGDRWETAETLNVLATVTRDLGDYAAALQLFEECLPLFRQLGDRRGEASALQALGNMALGLGDYDRARECSTQALALMRALGHLVGTIQAHRALSLAALFTARHDEARASADALLALGRVHQVPGPTGWGHLTLGLVALAEGNRRAARAHLGDCLATATAQARTGTGDEPASWALAGFAALAAAQHRPERALRLAAASLGTWYDAYGFTQRLVRRAVLDRWLGEATRHVSEAARARAEADGSAMTPEQAIAYALEDDGDANHAPAATPAATRRARDAAAGPLSPREREVAALVAQGLTNPQIAARLIISERTASRHVEHIRNKLGFTGRTQIAAWAARQGLDERIPPLAG